MTRTSFFQDLLTTVSARGLSLIGAGTAPPGSVDGVVERCRQLLSSRGEASGVALAKEVIDRFAALNETERLEVYTYLADELGPDPSAVRIAAETFSQDQSPRALEGLMKAVEPPRIELMRRINLAPGGTAALVEMRRLMLPHLREHPTLRALDADFTRLFSTWFNRGFLMMQPIDWQTPAHILEKIIAYEAVHAIDGWDDLRRRVEPQDRRCFAFFHPSLGDEPLIFVEVALTREIPGSIHLLLDEERDILQADRATTAGFYSISNCQEGLRGISFGNFLIKQVVEDLAREVPSLKTFVTLSPIPGLMRWIGQMSQESDRPEFSALLDLLSIDEWTADQATADAVTARLLPLMAEYFLEATDASGRPIDPVARFHLGNGARLERLNPMGDLSVKGLQQSAGAMVNYLYDISTIEENHEAFATEGRVATSRAVRAHLSARARSKAQAAPPASAAPATPEIAGSGAQAQTDTTDPTGETSNKKTVPDHGEPSV